jgi:hypothetical protein
LFLNIKIGRGKVLEMLIREFIDSLFTGTIVGGDANRKGDVISLLTVTIEAKIKELNINSPSFINYLRQLPQQLLDL